MDFQYKENNFFKENKYYIFYDEAFDRYIVSEVHKYNGNFYINESLQFKCTSLPCIEFSDIYYKKVLLNNFIGLICKALGPKNSLGIEWFQGQKYIPYYWNNINKLKILW